MKKQFIGIDRDGCLVGNLGDYKNNSPSQYSTLEMPLILPTIKKLKKIGLPVVIFSNQAGIEAGYTTLEKVTSQFSWLVTELRRRKINVLYSLFCPDRQGEKVVAYDSHYGSTTYKRGDGNSFRKPEKGMGEFALELLYREYECTFYVGDLSGKPDYAPGCAESDSDLKFAKNMGWDYLDIQGFLALK